MKYLLAILLLTTNVGVAAMTLSQYKEAQADEQKWAAAQYYLHGVGVGALLTSTAQVKQGRDPLFCQPQEMVLSQDHYIKLLDAFIAKNEVSEQPVEALLVMALVTAFPCP